MSLVFNITEASGRNRQFSSDRRHGNCGQKIDSMEAGGAKEVAASTIDAVVKRITSVAQALSGVMCVAVLLSLILLVVEIRSDAILTIDNANFAIQSIAPAMSNMTHSVESMLSGADASLDSVRSIAQASELMAVQSAPLLGRAINRTLLATEKLASVAMNPVLKLSLGGQAT